MESFLSSLRSNSGVRRDFAKLLQAADTHGQRLAELMPSGRFELAGNSRTFIPEDNPARLVSLLRDFIAE